MTLVGSQRHRKKNEDIVTKFVADLPHCVRNVEEKNVLLFKFRCNIFIGVRTIKEMPGSVTCGTLCISPEQNILRFCVVYIVRGDAIVKM
jgi:hypothetical protein